MDEMVNKGTGSPETASGSDDMGTTRVVAEPVNSQVDAARMDAEELGKTRVVSDKDAEMISGMEKGILDSLPIEVLYKQEAQEAQGPSEVSTPGQEVPKDERGETASGTPDTEDAEEEEPVREHGFLSGIVALLLTLTLVAAGAGVVIGCCVMNTGIVRGILNESNYAAEAEKVFMDELRQVAASCQAAEESVANVLPEGKMDADIQLYVGSVLSGKEAEIDTTSVEEAFISAIDADYASRKLRINEEGMATLKEVASGVGGLYQQAVSVPGLGVLSYLKEHFSVILVLVVINLYALSLVFMTILVKLRREHRWGIAMIWYAFIAAALTLGGIPLAGLLTGRYGILAVRGSVITATMTAAIRTISFYMVLMGAIYALCGIITTVIFLTRRFAR